MTKEEVTKILEKLQKTFQDKENDCFTEMSFARKHKMEMEEAAIRYKQEAYNDAWLTVWREIDKLNRK